MPLLKGKKNIGHNVKVEEAAGKKPSQAVAIALNKAGVSKGKDDAQPTTLQEAKKLEQECASELSAVLSNLASTSYQKQVARTNWHIACNYVAEFTSKAEDDLPTPVRVAGAARDAEEDGSVEAYGVKGVKSTPWRKTFKNQKAFEQWLEKNEGDVEVQGTRKAQDTTTQYATPPRKPHVLTSVALPTPVAVAQAYAPHKAEEFKKTFGKDVGHTREELEAYIKRCEARLKDTTSPWMKIEARIDALILLRKGIEMAKAELAKLSTAKDSILEVSKLRVGMTVPGEGKITKIESTPKKGSAYEVRVTFEDGHMLRAASQSLWTAQDHIQAAQEHEVAGNHHSALDHYKQARSQATDSAAKSKAEDGVAACQGYFAHCADAAKFTHPEAGKTRTYDSSDKALRAAVLRTRAGERVSVADTKVGPRVGGRDFLTCPKCGSKDITEIEGGGPDENSHQIRYKCRNCGKQVVKKIAAPNVQREWAKDALRPVRVGGKDALPKPIPVAAD